MTTPSPMSLKPRAQRFAPRGPLLVLALALGVTACAGREPRERQQFIEQPVELLYNYAAELVDERRWSEAASAFEEVERQHPYSSWARRSMLMAAYSQYMANQYEDSIRAAERFISLHPGNESAPYAYYLIATCHFEQIIDIGRDQRRTEQALAALQEVTRRYPESEYAADARLKIQMTYDQLAGKEMEVGRFYLNQQQHLAAIGRFRNVVDDPNLQRTTHAPEALHRLVESYLSVGLVAEAQRAAAVLGYNFPDSDWHRRAYALMRNQGLVADAGG